MRSVTVLEPWASGIILGTKRIENRPWRTRHRGPLLIHAAKSLKVAKGFDPELLRRLLPAGFTPRPGHLLGVVDVVDCVPLADVPPSRVAWASGPWCWVLDNPRPFPEPVPYRGQQLLYPVPDDLIPESFR